MSTTATPTTWSFEVNPGPYSPPTVRHSEIASAPSVLGMNDLQADAVRAALHLMRDEPRFDGAEIVLFKTTRAGRRTDQVWTVQADPRRPGKLRATR